MISSCYRNSAKVTWRIWLFLALLMAGCHEPTSGPPFDPHMDGLTLAKWITGDDAIRAINKLHGMSINVERGFIAHYEGTHDKAMVWVSEASSEKLAKRQVAVMIQKMKDNRRSPFGHYRTLQARDPRVTAFDGLGQVHYVFRDNKWVYWISADEKRIDGIFRHICRTR